MAAKQLKIVQNIKDKRILTWTEALSKRDEYRSGTLFIEESTGKRIKLELDQLGAADLYKVKGVSDREKTLMIENQALQERLALYERMPASATTDVKGPDVVITAPGPEETPLPEPPSDLDPIESVLPESEEDTSIDFQPEPKIYTEAELSKLKKEKLIVHAHELNVNVDLPDKARKDVLIGLCLDEQKAYLERKESL